MMRNAAAAIMLLSIASADPVSATDPSAQEETNCLMACDANWEHCATGPQTSAPKNFSLARISSPAQIKPSPAIKPQRTTDGR